MIVIKWIILTVILTLTINLGIQVSKQYRCRVNELKEMKNTLNAFKTKIKYERSTIKEIFLELSSNLDTNVKNIFEIAVEYLENDTADVAWTKALEEADTYLLEEDIRVLKVLNKLLGKTDVDGQLSQIDLTTNFLDCQISKARRSML